jgi:hypothetical protein
MSKAKKTKVTTELDRLATRVRTALRNQTKNVIEIGKLLIESRKHLEHGEWQTWLAENFDLTYHTALNYTKAAEYVSRKVKSETVSLFANVAPTVLYRLAEGDYDEREEVEILTQAKAGKRIDKDRVEEICERLAPPDDADDADHQYDDGGDDTAAAAENLNIAAILDGPPPAVPPPAPNSPPTDFALRDFDQAIGSLKLLMTKPSVQFARTIYNANDLEEVESFIHAVTKAIADRGEQ